MTSRRLWFKQSAALIITGLSTFLPFGLGRLLMPSVEASPHQRLRPPGALAEVDFVAACIGCGLCGQVCPPGCIQFYFHVGGERANTPYINPEQKGCILCNKCMQVCPTDALTEVPREKVNMGKAWIDQAACYPWVDKGVCGACVVICPLGERAIGFEFANLYRPIVKQACVGCGLCVEVCPHPSLPIRILQSRDETVERHRRVA